MKVSKELRIAEIAGDGGGIAAPYAGWLLAEMGATVVRVGAGSAAPSHSPERLALTSLAEGKATAEWPGTASDCRSFLGAFDIIICDDPPRLVEHVGSLSALQAACPSLVIGIGSTFGMDGPYAKFPAASLDAQAISGVAWSLGEPDRPPLSIPPGILEHQAGAQLAAGCLLAQLVVEDGKGGRIVDIALADVLVSYVAGNCRFIIHHGLEWQRAGRRPSGSGGAYPFGILPCKDGQVCLSGRTRDEWNRLVRAMGSPPWTSEPRYQRLRAMGQDYPEEVDALMRPWLEAHTQQELAAIALEHNLIVSPIAEIADVLDTPHFNEGGFFRTAQLDGQPVKVPSLPFRVGETRSADAPNIAGRLLSTLATAPAVSGSEPWPSTSSNAELPLTGMRVLDLGWVWSAPWVSTCLAELGAQVIKIENPNRPDNLRLAGKLVRDGQVVEGPSREMSPMFHQVNHGKLGISLNIKSECGRELVLALAAMSDIVIENMSPGSLERIGLGYEALRGANPRLVMLSMTAAGQFGALSDMRAYAPTLSSFVGLEALIGYRDETPIGGLNFALSDPSASSHGLVPLLAAYRRARMSGRGCYIDLSQLEALLGTVRPYLLDMQRRGEQPAPLGNQHPDMAPHGIYPAAEPDAWLTLVVSDDTQWAALSSLADGEAWARDPGLRRADERVARASELDGAVARWTRLHSRDSLVHRLRDVGIAASPVLSIEELWRDPHFEARQMKHAVEIPYYGPEDLFRAPWRFSDLQPSIPHAGPTTGEHNAWVFGELLGLSTDAIAALEADGVIP